MVLSVRAAPTWWCVRLACRCIRVPGGEQSTQAIDQSAVPGARDPHKYIDPAKRLLRLRRRTWSPPIALGLVSRASSWSVFVKMRSSGLKESYGLGARIAFFPRHPCSPIHKWTAFHLGVVFTELTTVAGGHRAPVPAFSVDTMRADVVAAC